MAYNFNDIASELDNGANIEDICKAFTDGVNTLLKERANERARLEQDFNDCCDMLAEYWEEALYLYQDMGKWPAGSKYKPSHLTISKDVFKELIVSLVENCGLVELFQGAVDEIHSALHSSPSAKKIVAKTTNDNYTDIMNNFFKEIGIN